VYCPLLNEGNILSFRDDLIGGLIKKANLKLIFEIAAPQDHY
jgi:hypothetical protein